MQAGANTAGEAASSSHVHQRYSGMRPRSNSVWLVEHDVIRFDAGDEVVLVLLDEVISPMGW